MDHEEEDPLAVRPIKQPDAQQWAVLEVERPPSLL